MKQFTDGGPAIKWVYFEGYWFPDNSKQKTPFTEDQKDAIEDCIQALADAMLEARKVTE